MLPLPAGAQQHVPPAAEHEEVRVAPVGHAAARRLDQHGPRQLLEVPAVVAEGQALALMDQARMVPHDARVGDPDPAAALHDGAAAEAAVRERAGHGQAGLRRNWAGQGGV
jgi:hypothetical protein